MEKADFPSERETHTHSKQVLTQTALLPLAESRVALSGTNSKGRKNDGSPAQRDSNRKGKKDEAWLAVSLTHTHTHISLSGKLDS